MDWPIFFLAFLLGAGLAAFSAFLWLRRRIKRLRDFVRTLDSAPQDFANPPDADPLLGELAAALGRLGRLRETERKNLARERDLARALFDALPDPIFILDRDRHILQANRSAVMIAPDEMIGQDFTRYLRAPAMAEAFMALLDGAAGTSADWTSPGDVPRHFKARFLKLADGEKGQPFVLLTLYDETQARAVEQMRADFVANASHELRTPLASLLGFVETLQGPAREDEAARDRFLAIMHEQANRMARLIRDLLSLSRLEMMTHRQPESALALGSILMAVRDALAPVARERGITLHLDMPADLPNLRGESDELTQLFTNLIDNAVKYNRKGGLVRIKVEVLPHDIRILVEDEGEGIAAEHLPRLTERFYRVDPARSRAEGGTGLGLAIVKHIVQHHRGNLRIESEVGTGSRFIVTLPQIGSS